MGRLYHMVMIGHFNLDTLGKSSSTCLVLKMELDRLTV